MRGEGIEQGAVAQREIPPTAIERHRGDRVGVDLDRQGERMHEPAAVEAVAVICLLYTSDAADE